MMKKSLSAMSAAKPFTQPHPVRNLGKFAHPPGKPKLGVKTTTVPRPSAEPTTIFNDAPDFKPKAAPKSNPKYNAQGAVDLAANKPGMDYSDSSTEYLGPNIGNAGNMNKEENTVGSLSRSKIKAAIQRKSKTSPGKMNNALNFFGKL